MTLYSDDGDSYDFEIPEELTPWIEFQRRNHQNTEKFGLGYYVLENGRIRKATQGEWKEFFLDIDSRRVDHTGIGNDCHVSTVFLGYDAGSFSGRCLLYESVIFGGSKKWANKAWRYETLHDAKNGHRQIVDALRQGVSPYPDGEESIWNFLDFLK